MTEPQTPACERLVDSWPNRPGGYAPNLTMKRCGEEADTTDSRGHFVCTEHAKDLD